MGEIQPVFSAVKSVETSEKAGEIVVIAVLFYDILLNMMPVVQESIRFGIINRKGERQLRKFAVILLPHFSYRKYGA